MLNKKGFSLIEVMIALVVLLFVALALMQTALISIDANMINLLREEATNIAEQKMSEARNTPFDSVVSTTTPETIQRNFRNVVNFQYAASRTVTSINTDNKRVDVTVTWNWKERNTANGNPYSQTVSTLIKR